MGSMDVEKWVDLSCLPRFKNGDSHLIDWEQSIGHNVPFKYGSVYGEIQILGHRKKCVGTNGNKASFLTIMIDKYMLKPEEVQASVVRRCKLYNFLHGRIIDMRPELVQYLVNKNDAYTISYKSNKHILTKCPICGAERLYIAESLSENGFSCQVCNDGISYPNKFITCVLQQVGVDFKRELSKKDVGFQWTRGYRYDFSFTVGGIKYLVEADGGRHKQQKKQDSIKTKLAIENGFRLIRVDCDYGHNDKFAFLRDTVLHSELAILFDLADVDWLKCHQFAAKNLIKEACDMWENTSMRVADIAHAIGVSNVTVGTYLKMGKILGLSTSYNRRAAILRNAEKKSKPVAYLNNGSIMFVFKNASEVEEKSLVLFKKQYKRDKVRVLCRKQYVIEPCARFIYITKEEYEQYKMINNNEVVLKEAT